MTFFNDTRIFIPGEFSSHLPDEAFDVLKVPQSQMGVECEHARLEKELAAEGIDPQVALDAMQEHGLVITGDSKVYEYVNVHLLQENEELFVIPISIHHGATEESFWAQIEKAVHLPDRSTGDVKERVNKWLDDEGPRVHLSFVFHPAELLPGTKDAITSEERAHFQSYISSSRELLDAWLPEVKEGRLASISVLSHVPRLMFGEAFERMYDHPDALGSINRQELESRPVHQELYNPLRVSVGERISLVNDEFHNVSFVVTDVDQTEVGSRDGIDRFTDYHIEAQGQDRSNPRVEGDGTLSLMLRYVQPSQSDEEPLIYLLQDEGFNCVTPEMLEELSGEQQEGITLYDEHGENLGTFDRKRKAGHPHQGTRICSCHVGFDASKPEAYTLDPGVHYWLFEREVADGGEPYTELAVVERDPESDTSVIYVGYEIDPDEVTVS